MGVYFGFAANLAALTLNFGWWMHGVGVEPWTGFACGCSFLVLLMLLPRVVSRLRGE